MTFYAYSKTAISKWDERFLRLAKEISTWSKDPGSKVGCVIVDPKRRIVATGYNGLPRGIEDKPAFLSDRSKKLCMTIHAELNAILTSDVKDHSDNTMFCTHYSCSRCTAAAIQAGVRKFVYPQQSPEFIERWAEDLEISRLLINEANAEFHHYTDYQL